MKERKQSNAKYKELSIQGKTYIEVDGKIHEIICGKEGSIIECGKITITKFNENSSSSKYKPDSSI